MKFAISMLALDGLEMSKACIASILVGSTPGKYRLFLTNNGSKDGTKEYFDELAAQYPLVTVIHNAKNEVFIGPNNHTFELAREIGATYFITINNDLTVPAGWLEKLEAEFANNPKAAVVGPKGTISQLSNRMLGFSRSKLDFIEGSLLCCKVNIVEKQGRLFSAYLKDIYHDDSDLSLRMQRAGHTIHHADFTVEHHNGQTCQRHPDAIARCKAANAHNQAVMLQKWSHWNRVRKFNFPILVRRRFAVGDVLLTTPIIKALKELWPLCPIDVETKHPSIFYKNPYVRTAADFIQPSVDTMTINLDMCYERTPGQHVLESYAKAAGVHPLHEPKLELYTDHQIPQLMAQGRWCAIHVGPTTWPAKNWPMERWREVIDWLRIDGCKVLLLGDRNTPGLNYDLDKRGQKGIQELAAMLKACQLFVGLDSFPAHAAAAVRVPCVVLYGITNPDCFKVATAPYIAVRSSLTHKITGLRNKIANQTFIPSNDDVMRTISVDAVKAAISSLVAVPA